MTDCVLKIEKYIEKACDSLPAHEAYKNCYCAFVCGSVLGDAIKNKFCLASSMLGCLSCTFNLSLQ